VCFLCFLSSRTYSCGIGHHDDHDAFVGGRSGIRTRSLVLPLIVLLVIYSQKRFIHFVRPLDSSFNNFLGASMSHFCLDCENGAPLTPYIFCFIASITLKRVESILFILIERFRALDLLHCLYIAFWSMSCFAFVFHFAVPCRAEYLRLLHYLWLVFCLYYHFLVVIFIFTNDAAYFVSFYRCSIIPK
jgi:hypothetical protein